MKHLIFVMVLATTIGCGKSDAEKALDEERARDQKADKDKATEEANKPPPVIKGSADPAGSSAAAPPDAPPPEPTTPAEIDHARNQAMLDRNDKAVLKYCDMEKLTDDKKPNEQALLGCTLSACRLKNQDAATKYAKGIADKGLRGQAAKVCMGFSIGI